jgi:hypothetical protein
MPVPQWTRIKWTKDSSSREERDFSCVVYFLPNPVDYGNVGGLVVFRNGIDQGNLNINEIFLLVLSKKKILTNGLDHPVL